MTILDTNEISIVVVAVVVPGTTVHYYSEYVLYRQEHEWNEGMNFLVCLMKNDDADDDVLMTMQMIADWYTVHCTLYTVNCTHTNKHKYTHTYINIHTMYTYHDSIMCADVIVLSSISV